MFLSSEFNNHNLIIEDDHQLELNNATTHNIQEASTISSKSLNTYICDICDYKTNRKHNYTIHLSSDKHIKQLAIRIEHLLVIVVNIARITVFLTINM